MINECLKYLAEDFALTPRIQALRKRFFDTDLSICSDRAVLWTHSHKQTEGQPIILRRAKALDYVLSNMKIFIKEGDLLAGNLASVPRAAPIFPEFSVNWIEKELNGDPYKFYNRPGDAYQVSQEVHETLLRDVIPYWKNKTHEDLVLSLLPDETYKAIKEVRGTDEDWPTLGGDGHTIPDYIKVLDIGLNGVIKEIKEKIDSLNPLCPDDLEQLPFLEAALITQEAVIKYANRYAELLADLAANEKETNRKKELEELSEVCRRVPAKPARTFYEAIQSMLFVNIPIQLENNGHSISFGRVDQYLYPYFIRDIENGVLDIGKVFEIMSCLWIKITEFSKLRDWAGTIGVVGNPLFQNLTIGGQDAFGQDVVNEVSYLSLACTKNLRMIQPSLTVRWFRGTSDQFMREAVKVVRKAGSMPAFFNDEVIIPAMLNIGVSYEDACYYGIVGCVEPAPHGTVGGRYGAGQPNFAKWVELAMNGGTDPRTGITLSKQEKDLTTFESFDEVMDAFYQQMDYFLMHHVITGNCVDKSWEMLTPNALLSSLISDCIQRGKEIKQGGAKYDYTGGESVGVIAAANSLATIKKVIFDDKKLTAAQVKHALDTDYNDMTTNPTGEEIRLTLLNAESKFGNDNDEPDMIASEIMRKLSQKLFKCKNTRHGKGPIGCFSIPGTATTSAHVMMGQVVGATPDGRKAGTPTTEGTSAYVGTEKKGPTALLNSYAKLPNILMPGGQLFNLKITPSAVTNDKGIENWVALIKAAFEKKAMELQFNIISAETLIAAKNNPEEHLDLIVRVAGYSGYFVDLCGAVQDDIIARTEHTL